MLKAVGGICKVGMARAQLLPDKFSGQVHISHLELNTFVWAFHHFQHRETVFTLCKIRYFSEWLDFSLRHQVASLFILEMVCWCQTQVHLSVFLHAAACDVFLDSCMNP